MRALFKSNNLIGDALYVGPALREWMMEKMRNPPPGLYDEVFIQTLPDHVAPLYQGMVRDLFNVETVFNRPEGTFDFEHVFDVSAAFALSREKQQHLARSYADLLGVTLPEGNAALKPVYIIDESTVQREEELDGAILISMFSASCESRDKNTPGMPPNKMVPFAKWKPMLQLLRKEFPETPIRFVGAPSDMDDVNRESLYAKDIIRPGEVMFGIPLNCLALIMQKAKLCVTIDNGVSHLAASQETPTFLMYPRCLAIYYICPVGNPNLDVVQMDPAQVSPAQLEFRLSQVIQKLKGKQ